MAGRLRGGGLCESFRWCHSRAVAAGDDPLPTRMRCKLAEYMLAQLEQDDGEDLYFEGGREEENFSTRSDVE